nr:transcription factor MYB1R1-like [Tanacetum cinerariifolium]
MESNVEQRSDRVLGLLSVFFSHLHVDESNEIMLFGVRVKVDPMRKGVIMNDLSQYVHLQQTNADLTVAVTDDNGYVSVDDVIRDHSNGSATGGTRER